MDVITIESEAYKQLEGKIDAIAEFVSRHREIPEIDPDALISNHEVCTFLHISDRTLRRLRAKKQISYTVVGGRCLYKVAEVRRMIDQHLIRSGEEDLKNLIDSHIDCMKQRSGKSSINKRLK